MGPFQKTYLEIVECPYTLRPRRLHSVDLLQLPHENKIPIFSSNSFKI